MSLLNGVKKYKSVIDILADSVGGADLVCI